MMLANSNTKVIILPVEGDSLSRSVFDDEARDQFRLLVDSMIEHPNVHELKIELSHIQDDEYIDTMHLNSASADANARLLADRLVESGLLDNYQRSIVDCKNHFIVVRALICTYRFLFNNLLIFVLPNSLSSKARPVFIVGYSNLLTCALLNIKEFTRLKIPDEELSIANTCTASGP